MKKRVLLVDLDPQGNATMGSGVDKHGVERSVYDVLVHRAPVALVAQHTGQSNFDVLPSNSDLTAAAREALRGNWGLAIGTLLLYTIIVSVIWRLN